ncbi:low affinity immunoglobulin gamma Fc region receptor II isoform X1 [Salmo salar]|uniref:low affinity immunoglobulin gamma Fc region receptor II isoform X1 n=1 Tax=Salmo salar TaxID=8030 RepID=UPI001E66BF9B|nr:low affinity immunoglobulin gamma Fc region receptor II-like isoform X1 [Salmo salar]
MERHCVLLLLLSTLVYCSLGQGGDLSLPASLIVSPDRSQFFEYESVSLSCEVQGNSTGWRVVRNTERGILSECHTDWGKQQGSSCIVSLITSDSGVYWCQSGSGEHSNDVNITVPDLSVPASLSVSPDRSQFFEYESVSLSCEVQGNSTGWRVVRNTSRVILSECNTDWGKQQGSSCITSLITSDSGVYWCESGSGEHSNAVNITVHAGAVILESPALPVTEGDSVTLRCRYQGTPSDLTADFYKDGSLIRTETTGEMTIPAVSKSDEGLYKCTNSEGESPESWITVTDNSPSSSFTPSSSPPVSPPSSLLPSSLILPLSVSGLVAALSISLIILLVLFCKKRNKHVAAEPRDVTYADVRITQDPEPRRRREKSPGADPVYSAVKTSNTTVPGGSGPGEVTYADINHTEKRQHNRRRENVVPDPVFSAVKTDRQRYSDPVHQNVMVGGKRCSLQQR